MDENTHTDPVQQPQEETKAPAATDGEAVSVEEAQAIFAERHDVASVLTDKGVLHRDGSITQR